MRQAAQVVARGKFGDDAAVDAVQFDLGIDFVGEDTFVCAVQGNSGFIAGAFNGEDERCGHGRCKKRQPRTGTGLSWCSW